MSPDPSRLAEALKNASFMREKLSGHQAESLHCQQLMAEFSHELKKPLNHIVTGASVCLEGILGPLNDEQTEYLTLIAESGDHLLNNLNELLEIIRQHLTEG